MLASNRRLKPAAIHGGSLRGRGVGYSRWRRTYPPRPETDDAFDTITHEGYRQLDAYLAGFTSALADNGR